MARSAWCVKLIALLSPLVLLCCMGMLAGGNLLVLIEYGYGSDKNKIGVWQTCFAAIGDQAAACVPVTDDRQCSEISSKMNAIGIMTCISGFNMLLTIVSVIADIQGCKIPVKNLTRIFFAWSLVPTVLAVAIAIMAMTNAQCGATQSLEDQEGQYGPAFQMIASSFFGLIVAMVIHVGAMFFLGNAPPTTVNEDDEDEDELA